MSEDAFVAHRRLLFTVAYEMLGSAADAEDAVQETWLKWSGVDRSQVRDPRAYLVRIVTRTALDALRAASRRREEYVGSWLPEPLLTTPDVAEDAELADSLSTAMLLVLETLTPTERAVFVLHDVFGFEYGELAEAVDKTQPAVRQIAHRARSRVAEGRPRRGIVSAKQTRRALEAFQRAISTGDVQDLVDQLAPDVVVVNDGGGLKQAVPRPVNGADRVARLMTHGLPRLAALAVTTEIIEINGAPALLVRIDGEIDSVVSMQVADGLVSGIYTMRNPEKLTRLGRLVSQPGR